MNFFTRTVSPRPMRAHCRAMLATMAFAAFLFAVTAPQSVRAQGLSNIGNDFIVSFLPNFSTPNVELHLTGADTDVTIHYPVNSPTFDETVSVTAGDITIVSLPSAAAMGFTINEVSNNAVRLFTEDGSDFVAYMINRAPFTSDAGVALPVNTMNVDYVVATYLSNLVSGDRSQFAVVAGFDNTTVNITPVNNMGTTAAGETRTVMLDRGEVFLGRGNSNGPGGDLTGTIVSANRPVGVTNGNICANVPGNAAFCDHIFQIAHPTQTWGLSIPVTNLPNRTEGSIYRILAAEDNTEIFQDGSSIGTINRNEFLETGITPDSHVFSAATPIFVIQFMTGSSRPGTGGIGDPAMGNMVPAEQYMTGYTFSTVGDEQFDQHFATIIADNADIGVNLMMDGSLIDPGLFSPISGTDLSAAAIEIDEGAHNTSSIRPHGVTVAGYNRDDSYMYIAGAQFEFIAPGEDTEPPICTFEIVNNEAHGEVRDDRPDDSGVFFVRISEGTGENVQLIVDAFTPGDPVVTYRLVLVDPEQNGRAVVVGIDGSGNRCESEIEIIVDEDPPPPVDTTPPECRIASINRENGRAVSVSIEVQDHESGIRTVEVLTARNAQLEIPVGSGVWYEQGETAEFDPPTTELIEILGAKIDLDASATIVIEVTDDAGNSTICDPVVATLSAEVPEGFDLGPNYPNPFNPTTLITFQVKEASFVSMKVFDLMGREVATLVNETLEPGTYSVDWDGKTSSGEHVAGGVYLYSMRAGTFQATRSMVLLK